MERKKKETNRVGKIKCALDRKSFLHDTNNTNAIYKLQKMKTCQYSFLF